MPREQYMDVLGNIFYYKKSQLNGYYKTYLYLASVVNLSSVYYGLFAFSKY